MSEVLESLNFLRTRLIDERTFIENEALLAGFDIAVSILDDEIKSQKEWERINALTHEELSKELELMGYTEERLSEMATKFQKILKKRVNE